MRKFTSIFGLACLVMLIYFNMGHAQFSYTLKSHRVGQLSTSITNYGLLGSEGRDLYDPEYGEPAPSAEFPGESNIEYLFSALIWIGATVEDPYNPGIYDTLVSIGDDGWWSGINELNPVDSITRYSGIADDELITSYADTMVIGVVPDPNDGRPHTPLGIRINSHSFSWIDPPYDDFVIVRYCIENILDNDLEGIYIGFYYDGDVLHTSEDAYAPEEGAQDDICGYLESVDAAYIIDNNGQPYDGIFTDISPAGICGIKFLGSSQPDMQLSFNWWISNVNSDLDWGPQLSSNYDGPFPGGGNGTPGGDIAKYMVMSNGEFDYEQFWCDFDYSDAGWISPPANAYDLANGFDTRFLFSFGPLNIPENDSAYFYIAMVAGDLLHADPDNYENNLRYSTDDSTSITSYLQNLDFTDFINNCQSAVDAYLGMTDIQDDLTGYLPKDYGLSQNYPNPFNASTTIKYNLPTTSEVTIEIYDILGRKIETLLNDIKQAGYHQATWNACEVSSGLYFYRIQAGEFTESKKMVILK
ncbi:MAG: T9SS type A sorting domain-containing protein [candidate division Zixibacteria bacterium]|nr:T9SS type A sorting domain-containing protein [candidate division Zixibacteria bacterium]